MAQDLSILTRLKKLFSTDVIVRNVGGKKLKVVDTEKVQFATDRNSLRDRFNRLRSSTYNVHNRDMSMSYQAARLELFRDYDCVGPDTIIPLPDGSRPTIKELTEKYKDNPQERFYVFSYDKDNDSTKLGKAYHPRKKGKRRGYKVTFDDGKYIVGSLKHPFVMRNGEKKRLFELRVGDSVMPFYQKDFYNEGYRHIYNFSKGWQSEHRLVAEACHRPLEKNEVVHHKDFDKTNNLPENLEIMLDCDHRKYHAEIANQKIWSPENREKQICAIREGVKNRKPFHWFGKRKGKNNPFFGKIHSEESNELRSDTLREVFKDRDQSEEKNPKYRNDITFENVREKAFEFYKEYSKINLTDFLNHINCDRSTLANRLEKQNTNWKSFKEEVETSLNHKIVDIEFIGMVDVYDVTVEKYENFATDSCYVGNTMDMDPILASALDIISDECATDNEMGQTLSIKTDDDNIKSILDNLFYDILNIDFNLWSWTRNILKYGDFFLRLDISPEYGIFSVDPLSPYEVTRIEGIDPTNKNYVKFQHDGQYGGQEYENYEMAHFRLLSDSNFLPYGRSHLEPARRVWKQLTLLEDAMLINRIMRAPERRIFYIDIGNIAPNEVDPFMERMVNQMKKVPYIDEKTGDYNLRFNLQNMVEDFYLPVRGGDSGTKIENLSGLEWTGIDDIEYVRNKMMAALKIPKAFLGYDESIGGKATLAAEDVRFARTIQRIQKIIVSELYKLAIIHLYVQGFTDSSLVNFELKLTNPSTIFEQEKVALWGDKMSVANDMIDSHMFSQEWVYQHLFNLAEDEIEEIQIQVVNNSKTRYRLQTIEDDGTDPSETENKIDVPASDEGEAGGDSLGGADAGGGLGGGFSGDDFGGEEGLFEGEVNEPETDNRPEDVKREQDKLKKHTTSFGKSDERDDKDTKDIDNFAKRDRNVKKKTFVHKDKRHTDHRLGNFSRPVVKKSLLKELKSLNLNKKTSRSMMDEENILDD